MLTYGSKFLTLQTEANASSSYYWSVSSELPVESPGTPLSSLVDMRGRILIYFLHSSNRHSSVAYVMMKFSAYMNSQDNLNIQTRTADSTLRFTLNYRTRPLLTTHLHYSRLVCLPSPQLTWTEEKCSISCFFACTYYEAARMISFWRAFFL